MDIITEGTEVITWGSPDFADFLEKISAVVCDSAYDSLTRVQNNWSKVTSMAQSWSEGIYYVCCNCIYRYSKTKSKKIQTIYLYK